jgi:hypothetical protein
LFSPRPTKPPLISQWEIPPGWKFWTKVLDRDLTVQPPAPKHLAWVTQDEFNNTYQGCGYDTACSYTP